MIVDIFICKRGTVKVGEGVEFTEIAIDIVITAAADFVWFQRFGEGIDRVHVVVFPFDDKLIPLHFTSLAVLFCFLAAVRIGLNIFLFFSISMGYSLSM